MRRPDLIAHLQTLSEPPDRLSGVYCVYALIDPRDYTVGYIGTSHLPALRLAAHLSLRDKNVAKNEWVRALLAADITPRMLLLEVVPGGDDANLAEHEQVWMRHALEAGMPLTNQERAFQMLRASIQ